MTKNELDELANGVVNFETIQKLQKGVEFAPTGCLGIGPSPELSPADERAERERAERERAQIKAQDAAGALRISEYRLGQYKKLAELLMDTLLDVESFDGNLPAFLQLEITTALGEAENLLGPRY